MQKIFINSQNGSVTMAGLFDEFIRFKRIINSSEETIKYYKDCFRYFSDFMACDLPCREMSKNTFYDYVEYLQTKNITDCTINSYLRGLRAIIYYGMELGYIPKFEVKLIKAQKKIKETYTDEELKLLLKKPNLKKCTFEEYRNWVIINYLLGTGNRLATMVNVKIEDVDLNNYALLLKTTKNRQQQVIPISSTLANVLKEYLLYRKGEPSDYLFCNRYGKQLHKSGVENVISKYNRTRGVNKTSIHLFRHTFAKKWILAGGDIFRLQKILGHSGIEVVKEYVNMFNADLHKQFDNFNPLDTFVKENGTGEKIKMKK